MIWYWYWVWVQVPLIFLYPGRLTHLTCQHKTWLSGKNDSKVDSRVEPPPEIEMAWHHWTCDKPSDPSGAPRKDLQQQAWDLMDKNTWHQFCFRETLFVFKSCMAFTLRIQTRICQILRLMVISTTRCDETAKAPIIVARCDNPPSSSKFSDPIPASVKR